MSQNEAYNALKKNRNWMKTKDVAKVIKVSNSNASTNLGKLHKNGFVMKKKIKISEGGTLWKSKD